MAIAGLSVLLRKKFQPNPGQRQLGFVGSGRGGGGDISRSSTNNDYNSEDEDRNSRREERALKRKAIELKAKKSAIEALENICREHS